MTGPVLSTKDAAAYCGIAVQTLYNAISQGVGPKHHKRGRRNAFFQSDLDAWNAATLEAAPVREVES